MAEISGFQVPYRGLSLTGAVTSAPGNPPPRLLALHGGGKSNHQTAQYLLSPVADQGISAAALDFIGHGGSGGELSQSSLNDRVEQAVAVARHLGMQAPVSLIASSMGGHVACRLIDRLAPESLVLYCPAAYECAAEDLAFGPDFQRTIRATTDFASSPAFEALERFEGRLLLVLGDDDAVIPQPVIDQYQSRALAAKSVEILRLPTGHLLHNWLRERPDEAARVQQRVLATLL